MAARRRPSRPRPPGHSSLLNSSGMEGAYPRNPPIMESAYMREVQRRMDNSHKSRLHLTERQRVQTGLRREQRTPEGLGGPSATAGRSYDKPWVSTMASNRKMDITNTGAKEVQHSPAYPRAPITGRGAKLPSLSNIMGKKQKVLELSEAPDTKSSVTAAPDNGPSFQAQRLQLKAKSSPPPRQGSAGAQGRRTNSGSLCCGDKAEEEEEEEARSGEDEGQKEPGETGPASRLCRQRTGHILQRLRRERLCGAGAEARAEPPGSPSTPLPADRLPFCLGRRPGPGREGEEAQGLSQAARPTLGHPTSSQEAEEARGPSQAARPSLGPATSSRGTQTPSRPDAPPTSWAGGAGQLVRLLAGGPARLQPIAGGRLGGEDRPGWGQGARTGAPAGGGFLRPPLSTTVLAVSGPRSQELRQPAPCREEGESQRAPADPEALRKLQESLLQEEEVEEGDLCRICLLPGGTPLNPLLEPCKCVGSLQFVHHDCLKQWLQAKVISGAPLSAVTTCELCKHALKLDFDDFDVLEFHRKRAASQEEEQMSNSSLYMAVLLHLYEQRFTELMQLLSGTTTTYQFTTADSQPEGDASHAQNLDPEDEEEEESGDPQPRRTITCDSSLHTLPPRDA
ncbi:uncharacterized protein LOC127567122 [Pristis pectinata]|uniref:uncharacterized protein LOC127567122 n=1 Tax=Pristis pectinata TaxID=685728 RepID=UPI00223D4C44|nr:uncharacterized protein LOC127567122 [Pristis pectinata]